MLIQLQPRLWQIEDEFNCTAYLLLGNEKALLIDTGMGVTPVLPQVREVTQLPVELLVTHAHYDHYAAVGEFDSLWLSRREEAALPLLEQLGGEHACVIPREKLRFFDDDAVFNAGGLTVRPLPLPGHTPGSVVFVCPELPAVFTGDAIGSGTIVLMSIAQAADLRPYLASLRRFAQAAEPFAAWPWYGGHASQSGMPGTADYNPPSLALTRDMITLVEKLLAGELTGEEVPEGNSPGGVALRAHWGRAGIIYLQEQVR